MHVQSSHSTVMDSENNKLTEFYNMVQYYMQACFSSSMRSMLISGDIISIRIDNMFYSKLYGINDYVQAYQLLSFLAQH